MYVLAAAAVTVGACFSAAPAANAAGIYYNVNYNRTCVYTYNDSFSVAGTFNPWSPYAYFCEHLRVGYPPEYWIQGGLDIQKYCSWTYPGSRAVVVNWTTFDRWRCAV